MNRLFFIFTLLCIAAVSYSCGNGDSDSDGRASPMALDEFYANLKEMNDKAAAGIAGIESGSRGQQRFEQAAIVFEEHAADLETLSAPVEAALLDDVLAETSELLAEALRELATGDGSAAERVESLVQDYELVCINLDAVADVTIGSVQLNCTFGDVLTE